MTLKAREANLLVNRLLAFEQKDLAPALVSTLDPFLLALVHDGAHEEKRARTVEIKALLSDTFQRSV